MKKARLYLASLEDQDEDLSVIDQDDTNAHGVSDDVGLVEAIQEESQVGEELSEAEDIQDEAGDLVDGADQLALAGEELEEIQETLEAMKEDMASAPEYAKLALLSRTQCLYERLGVNLKLASNENFHGDRFQDGVFVESLEASLKDVSERIVIAIGSSITQAVNSLKELQRIFSSTAASIHKRAKAVKKKLQDKTIDDPKKAASNVFGKYVIKAAVQNGNKLGFGKDYVSKLEALKKEREAVIKREMDLANKFVEGIDKITDVESARNEGKPIKDKGTLSTIDETRAIAHGYIVTLRGEKGRGFTIKDMFKGSKIEVFDKPVAPGGVTLVAKPRSFTTAQMAKFENTDAVDIESSLEELVADKNELVKAADFVINMTAPGEPLSKQMDRAAALFFNKIETKAKALAGFNNFVNLKFLDALFIGSGYGAVKAKTLISQFITYAYSASLALRSAWLKSMAAINSLLTAVSKAK